MGSRRGEVGPACDGSPPFLQSVRDVLGQRTKSVPRADELVAHLCTESPAERARVGADGDPKEEVPHAFAFSNRRLRAAASCPSSRPTSALATAMPRDVSR